MTCLIVSISDGLFADLKESGSMYDLLTYLSFNARLETLIPNRIYLQEVSHSMKRPHQAFLR